MSRKTKSLRRLTAWTPALALSAVLALALSVLLGIGGPVAQAQAGRPVTQAQDLGNGLASTPPMGWNSWNVVQHNVTETLIKQTADSMVSTGLAAEGYKYINIDAGWYLGNSSGALRDGSGRLEVDTSKFPDGIAAVASYVHSKGLKLGIYLWQDSIGHEQTDASQIASFGVDYLKYDCYNTPATSSTWTTMRDALRNTGRPILYSIHHSNELGGMSNVASVANMERVTNDVQNYYQRAGSGLPSYWYPTIEEVDYATKANHLLQPGFVPDMDMLWVGHTGQTTDEYKTQFAMWSMLSSPLIMGNDIRNMDPTTLSILSNPEIIQVDQDPALNHTTEVSDVNNTMAYVKPLGTSGTVKAVALMNRNSSATDITVNWSQIGIAAGTATVRDLWARADRGSYTNSYTVSVPAHGTAMLKIVGGGSGPSGTGPITSGLAGKCVDDNGGSSANGTAVQLWDCNGSAAQTWSSSNGTLTINGKCMDVVGQGTADGTKVDIWDCNGGANQQWTAGANGSLVSTQSGKCLDDPGSTTTNGTQLEIWTCNGGTNQKWTLP